LSRISPALTFTPLLATLLLGKIRLEQGDAVMADSLFSYLVRVIIKRG